MGGPLLCVVEGLVLGSERHPPGYVWVPTSLPRLLPWVPGKVAGAWRYLRLRETTNLSCRFIRPPHSCQTFHVLHPAMLEKWGWSVGRWKPCPFLLHTCACLVTRPSLEWSSYSQVWKVRPPEAKLPCSPSTACAPPSIWMYQSPESQDPSSPRDRA